MNNSTKSLLLHYKNSDLDQYGLTLNMVEKAIDNIGFQSNDLFRFTFGSDDPKSKSILTWLLNRFIPQDILSIQIRNSEPAKRAFLDKGTRLDILSRVTDSSNTEHDVNIEIQNYGTTLENTERSQLYVAKQIVDLNPEGSYNLSSIQAVHIMICNKLDLFSDIDEFYHEYIYIEKDRHEELPGYLSRIIYIETEKLKPLAQTKPIEEWTDLEKLGFILRYSQTKEMHDIIQLLIRENEVFQRMQEKRDEFFMSTIDSLNAIKRYYE